MILISFFFLLIHKKLKNKIIQENLFHFLKNVISNLNFIMLMLIMKESSNLYNMFYIISNINLILKLSSNKNK